MLTILTTLTCEICGRVEEHRVNYKPRAYGRNIDPVYPAEWHMSVIDPEGFGIGEYKLICSKACREKYEILQ
jgi:hypothetical protein